LFAGTTSDTGGILFQIEWHELKHVSEYS